MNYLDFFYKPAAAAVVKNRRTLPPYLIAGRYVTSYLDKTPRVIAQIM